MERNKRWLLSSLIINFGFIAVSIIGILKGIAKHELWRIIIAAAGGAIFLFFAIIIIYNMVKSSKKPA